MDPAQFAAIVAVIKGFADAKYLCISSLILLVCSCNFLLYFYWDSADGPWRRFGTFWSPLTMNYDTFGQDH